MLYVLSDSLIQCISPLSSSLIIKTDKTKIINLFLTVVTFVMPNNAIALSRITTRNGGIYN